MQFGCCIPIGDYGKAVDVGFDYVEFSGAEIYSLTDEGFERTRKMLSDGMLPCLSLNSYCKEVPVMVGPGFDEKYTALYAERVCGRAGALGVKMIGIGAPRARQLPPDYDMDIADAQCRRFLRITSDIAAKYDIDINFEALNPYVCQYGISSRHAVEQIRAVGAPNLFLVVDFYHRHLAEENVVDFQGFSDLIRHAHISTCEFGFSRGYPGAEDFSLYKKIIAALKAAGYKGTISIEASSNDFAKEGAEALKMLRSACENAGGES